MSLPRQPARRVAAHQLWRRAHGLGAWLGRALGALGIGSVGTLALLLLPCRLPGPSDARDNDARDEAEACSGPDACSNHADENASVAQRDARGA